MSEFDYSKITDKSLTEMSDRMIKWYYMYLRDEDNIVGGREFVRGVSELELLTSIDYNSNGCGLMIEKVKELAEKHSNAVLDDYIKTHSAKSDTVSTTYPLETKVKVESSSSWYTKEEIEKIRNMYGDRFANGFGALRTNDCSSERNESDKSFTGDILGHKPVFIYNHNSIGRVEVTGEPLIPLTDEDIKSILHGAIRAVEDKHLFGTKYGYVIPDSECGEIRVKIGGKELDKKDDYGRVYSDLEGQGDKGSPAKNEDLIEKMRTTSFPFTMANEFLEEFANSDSTSSAKTEVSRGTYKNKYGIGQKVFVINQNEISECVIQDISDGEDGIEYVAYDDYGCDFKLMEKEVFTTVDELLSYLHELAKSL